MKMLVNKLKKVAALVAAEKPKLHFFALVHRVDAPDRWDLLVSSDQLAPWSMEALRYMGHRLNKALKVDEMIRISRIVVLPRNSEVIADLTQNQHLHPGEVTTLHPADHFDQAVVIWPVDDSEKPGQKSLSRARLKSTASFR